MSPSCSPLPARSIGFLAGSRMTWRPRVLALNERPYSTRVDAALTGTPRGRMVDDREASQFGVMGKERVETPERILLEA